MHNSTLDCAIHLGEQGFACFPCLADKRPATHNGFHSAVSEPEKLEHLWRLHPAPLIGVATGQSSGVDVLDIDAKHPEARRWWLEHRVALPPTRSHRTRSGGLHLFFQSQPGLRCSVSKLAKGVDIRAHGGYVIWWPAGAYAVLCAAEIAPWPDWVLSRLTNPEAQRLAVVLRKKSTHRPGLSRLAAKVATSTEGARNIALFSASCRAAEGTATASDFAFACAVLQTAARRAGLEQAEIIRTIYSACRQVRGSDHD